MVKKKGKEKSTQRRQILRARFRLIARLILALVLVVATAWALYLVRSSASLDRHFQLAELDFHGAVHVDTAQLRSLIKGTFQTNTLKIDLDRLRSLIEAEVWVESATIRRTLPDRISVFIEERKPVAIAAIDGNLRVVDKEGVLLAPFGPEFESLNGPVLKGLNNVAVENAREGNAAKVRLYLTFISELDSNGKNLTNSLSEVIIDESGSVSVVPEDEAFRINLGEGQFLEHYQVYLNGRAYVEDLREQHGAIESVDVTYDNKIVVRTPGTEELGDSTGE